MAKNILGIRTLSCMIHKNVCIIDLQYLYKYTIIQKTNTYLCRYSLVVLMLLSLPH